MEETKKNYYYNKTDICINKYLIELDVETLKELRKEIINNCSTITHKKYQSTKEPNYHDIDHIRNYRCEKLGMVSHNDFYSPDELNYQLELEYDYYEHSHLVNIIDNLLAGNMYIIDELINPTFLKEKEGLNLKLESETLKDEISDLIDRGLYKSIKSLINEKLDKLITEYENKLTLEKFYLIKINYCLKITLVDKINKREFNKIISFFEDSNLDKNVSTGLKKVLKPKSK